MRGNEYVTARTAPQLSPDVKQAYPVATGACKGFDPLDPKGRTFPNLSGSGVLPSVYCTVLYFSTVQYSTYQSRRSACELTQ